MHRGATIQALALAFSIAIFLAACSGRYDATQADRIVLPLQDTLSPMPPDEFCATGIARPGEVREPRVECPTAKDGEIRDKAYDNIVQLGRPGAVALGRALNDPQVSLRRAAALALEWLGGGYDPRYRTLDIEPALPALQLALADEDELVRSWSAQAIAHVGSSAAPAVPALINLLLSAHEGDRIGACIGLRGIGPAARTAVPALSGMLADPSRDVREFAQSAIAAIR